MAVRQLATSDDRASTLRCADRAARRSTTTAMLWLCGLGLLIASVSGCGRTEPPAAGVRGRVTSKGQPLPNATVRYQAQSAFVRTDGEGRFELPVAEASRTGTQPTAVHASTDDTWIVTASHEGYLIAGRRVRLGEPDEVTLELSPLPATDHEEYPWVHPDPNATRLDHCGNCHGEIHEQWNASAHSRGTANRRFLNLYEGSNWHGEQDHGWSLLAEHPEGRGVCAACHAPSATLEQLAIGDIREVDPVAARGVHCDFCHKVRDSLVKEPVATASVSSRVTVTDGSPAADGDDANNSGMPDAVSMLGLAHGRFGLELLRPSSSREQLFFGPLDDVDRGEDSYAAVYRDSRYCASCHEGIVFGVPVYSTYSEWLASAAREQGKQCQDCHMRPNGQLTNIAPGTGGVERDPQTLASHEMLPGGRLAMLQRSLRMGVDWLSTQDAQATLEVRIQTQDVGHRVPTGFIDRHLLLVLEALDAEGQALAVSSGPVLPKAAGDLQGQAGQLFARRWVDAATDEPLPFWRPGGTLSDNRLEPDATRVERFAFPNSVDRVRVRLLFRGFWAKTAHDKSWPDDTLTVQEVLLERAAK